VETARDQPATYTHTQTTHFITSSTNITNSIRVNQSRKTCFSIRLMDITMALCDTEEKVCWSNHTATRRLADIEKLCVISFAYQSGNVQIRNFSKRQPGSHYKHVHCTGWAKKKPDHFRKYVTPAYDDVGRRSIYHNVPLFIRSKMGIFMAPYLNILCINSGKRHHTENTN